MNIDQFINATNHLQNGSMRTARPRVVYKDGFSVSIQAGEYLYSRPRKNVDSYLAVELGFPSEKMPEIADYAEDQKNPLETVCCYVPTGMVQRVLDAHGGIDEEKTFAD